jgi:hypothetical protein
MPKQYEGRFYGRRVNCENVPLLPASTASQVLEDPRKIPYLLIWSGDSGQIKEAARLVAYSEPNRLDWTGWIEIKRVDGTRALIRTLERRVLGTGAKARLLVCPVCSEPRRALYGWEPGGNYTSSAQRSRWQCRSCAGLRYSSEGGALVVRPGRGRLGDLFRAFGSCRRDRPEPWYPHVFSSPQRAAESGFPFEFLPHPGVGLP